MNKHTVNFATTNIDKFHKAERNLAKHGITVKQIKLDLEEIQTEDGKEIAERKARQAFNILHEPVLVSDDTWGIPALNGFPGTMMKQCNHFLKAEDWLRLMQGIEDRSLFLTAHLAMYDGNKLQNFTHTDEAYFLNQIQGVHSKAPHLTVVAWKNEKRSIAECITSGDHTEGEKARMWQEVAECILATV